MRHGLFWAESVRQAGTGVQSNCLPHRGTPFIGDPLFAKEAHRGVGSVDLEPLVAATVVGDAEVMQDATEEDEFVVVVRATAQTRGGRKLAREEVTTDAVVGDERRGDVER